MHDYILKYKLKRLYRTHPKGKRFLNLKDIRTVLMLFDMAHFQEASIYVNQLKELGKEVVVYSYQKKKDLQKCSSTGYHILLQKEAGQWFGNPVYAMANELGQATFDAVIDLTICRNIPLEYLLARTHASVKTGLKKNNFPQYDLSITDLPEAETEGLQVTELGKQIMHYLEVIHTR